MVTKPERPPITPEYLESVGPPTVFTPAKDILAIMSGDSYETVDMTFEQAKYLHERLGEWVADD